MPNERKTNVDIEELSKSELVLTFMRRMVREQRRAGEQALIVDVAHAAADAFDLRSDDGRAIARTLLAVAAEIVAVGLACAR